MVYALQADQAGHALTADDATTLGGLEPSVLDQSAHVATLGNPHGVTPTEIGAATPGDIGGAVATHAADVAAHHARTSTFGELVDQIADTQIPALITRDAELQTEVTQLQAQIAALDTLVTTLQANLDAAASLLAVFSFEDLDG